MENDRRVAETSIDEFRISTVFLGLDHGFGKGDPLLFETMVFSPEGDPLQMNRYFTWEEAKEGHRAFVEEYKAMNDGAGSDVGLLLRSMKERKK